jgi:molecular chaperone DnaK
VATGLIERNTTIPNRKSQVFSTASDSQAEVEIHVVQGERPFAADNRSLGKFTLDGIPAAARGVPQIEVTFDVDKDGILKVSAVNKATGRSQHITIHSSSGLSEDEVERLRKEAEAHATEDRKRREFVDARNRADNAIYAAEKALREMGAQMPADGKSREPGSRRSAASRWQRGERSAGHEPSAQCAPPVARPPTPAASAGRSPRRCRGRSR